MKHNNYTYQRYRCRCDKCRAAHRAYQLAFRRRPRAPESLEHGKRNTYINYACRCDECRAAMMDAQRQRRQAQQKKK